MATQQRTKVFDSHLGLFVLWCRLLLGSKGVSEGSRNGNRRPNDGVALHSFLEYDGGNNNDDYTLGGVQNGRSHSTDVTGECEGYIETQVRRRAKNKLKSE